MFSQQFTLALLIVGIINLIVTIVFLALFSYRLHFLGSFSMTDKYKNYFPKFRIFISLIYVAFSIALLTYNLAVNSYSQVKWYEYILQGGGGQCINSIILLIQLGVLKLQLNKERPYTKFHIYYFIYLSIISFTRFVFTLLDTIQSNDEYVNLIISGIMVVDGSVQLGYWIMKKQSLPQFVDPVNVVIDDLRNHSRLVPNRIETTERSYWKDNQDRFPYIVPFVSLQNGKIRIILEALNPRKSSYDVESTSPPLNKNDTTFLSPFLKPIPSDQSNSQQLISVSFYSIQQIKKIYVNCGRFPLQKKLYFDNIELTQMVKPLQQFLQQLLKQKRWYQPSILKLLKISSSKIKQYNELLQKQLSMNNQTEIDKTVGIRLLDDKNSTFCSILIYKHLWVSDHYQFYIKAIVKVSNAISYPIRRFSEFQDHHLALKHLIKTLGKNLQLPTLPKKHLFHWNEDQQTNQRQTALQKYLRKLCNDYTLMEMPALRQKTLQFLFLQNELSFEPKYQIEYYQGLQVKKGEISKAMIKNEYVTYYQFKIFQNGIELKPICKRFSQFEELHYQLLRWMNNIQITYKMIALPQKVYFKSENHRHDKLKGYLQNIAEIKEIGKVYAVNAFFNIFGNQSDNQSEISIIQEHHKVKKSQISNHILDEVIELKESIIARQSDSAQSSRRFSHMLNDMGNQDYD